MTCKVPLAFACLCAGLLAFASCTNDVCNCGGSDSDSDTDGDADAACGPCADIAAGEWLVSTNPWIDNVFKSAVVLAEQVRGAEEDYRASLMLLAAKFDVDVEGMALADATAAVKAEIEAELNANIDGSLTVTYRQGECSSDVTVAAAAMYTCEQQSGCGLVDDYAPTDPYTGAVACEGMCMGGCTAACEGQCAVPVNGGCAGTCLGSCAMVSGATCVGVCHGACNGECSLIDPLDQCHGHCSGDCTGVCEMPLGSDCDQSCHGLCSVSVNGECAGQCLGSCSGECIGGCLGEAFPPSFADEGQCVAASDCQAAATILGQVSSTCPAAQLTLDCELAAPLDTEARAEFMDKLRLLEREMLALSRNALLLRTLLDPDYAAEHGLSTPAFTLQAALEEIIDGPLDSYDIPPSLIPCVIPALEDAIGSLSNTAVEASGLIEAHLSMLAIVG